LGLGFLVGAYFVGDFVGADFDSVCEYAAFDDAMYVVCLLFLTELDDEYLL